MPFSAPDLKALAIVSLLSAAVALAGWLGARARHRGGIAWAACLFGTGAAVAALAGASDAARMLGLVLVFLTGMKAVCYAAGSTRLTLSRYLCFSFLWLGMRPEVFAAQRRPFRPDWQPPILRGAVAFALGVGVLFLSKGLAGYAAEATLLAGFSLALHFGILSVMSGVWRAIGFPAYALFRDPWKAATLGEFWARRWNVGFAEMAAVAVARPLRRTRRHRLAIPAAFLFSGLAHEIAITLPARGGYGGPLAYFLLHGALVWIEPRVSLPSWMHRLLLFAALVFPLPLLFPSAFIDAALRPLLP